MSGSETGGGYRPDLLECRSCDWSKEYEDQAAAAFRAIVGCPGCGAGVERTLGIGHEGRDDE